MKKSFFFTILFLLLFSASFSQPWIKLLPQNKSNQDLTFYDYQNAFNEYWSDYQIDNGWYLDQNGDKQKAYGWKQFKRWEYFWQYRIDKKTGKFPSTNAYLSYKEYISKNVKYPKNGGDWTCLGTNTSTGGYSGIGRINTVAFHPTNTDIYWIGAPAGGLWVTYNNGNSWSVLTDSNAVLGISTIIIPSDFDISQTIYIGTGDRDARDNLSVGILKSTDAGATWQQTGLVFEPQNSELVNKMLLHPNDDNIIFAATSDGFYISNDAAETWIKTTSFEFVDIELCPNNTDIIYASTRGGSIYKTTDGGINWSQKFSTGASARAEIAVTNNNPAVLYILAAANDNGFKAIYKSVDYGENFSLVFDDYNLMGWGDGYDAGGQGWYDLSLAVDPTDENNLYVGGVNTWRSTDGGVSWELANHWYGGFGVPAVHADKHYFAFRNNESVFFECNDGGIYSSSDGITWNHLTNGITISQIYGLGTAQTVESMNIVGLQDNGTKLQDNNTWSDVIGGDGMLCKIDYDDENIQYGSLYYGQIYRTTNKWASSTAIYENLPNPGEGNWVTPIVIDPIDHNTIYIGYSSLYKSTNMGNTFETIGNFGGKLDRIAICPTDNQYIYVTNGSSISRTTNGGTNWESINYGLPVSSADITYIEVKYNDPNTAWVTLSGYNEYGIYKTTNGGQNWTNISTGLPQIPVNCVIQNKLESTFEQIYVGTDFGVFIKEGNNDWTLFSQNLPNVTVSELDIYYDVETPENSRLRASTYGRGLWETPLQLSGNYAPFINTLDAQNVTINSADFGGDITNNFGSTITESGILISTLPNPLIGGTDVIQINTDPLVIEGEFSVFTNTLTAGTKYYYRAYAINENGIGYGAEKTTATLCAKIESFPWFSGCEDEGEIPICFSQKNIINNTLWVAATNNSGFPYYPNSGDYFFLIKKEATQNSVTKLILPTFNLSVLDNASITFTAFNASVFNIEDTLTLWYKNINNTNWQLIETYDYPINEWTEFTVNLPNLADEYDIAFQANVNTTRGIAIDDISIDYSNNTDKFLEKIFVSPIPSTGKININILGNTDNYKIEIFDINGKQILNKTSISSSENVDLSGFNNGIYILQIKTSNNIYTKKIIIKK
ncbi:MAG: T9SS type A sorting domain-containing protein [Bacteroidales bacterium]|nr:T9SS type A sorting domain-containing protein [Bacteroidales bacterium]